MDPRTSRWLSTDPALTDYVNAEKSNSTSGGIYNSSNFNLYHYANNNPIKYTDPNGRDTILFIIPFNSTRIDNLRNSQKSVMENKNYKQGAGGPFNLTVSTKTTWCNQATFEVARKTDPALATAMYNRNDPNGWETNANAATENLESAANNLTSSIIEVSPENAQKLANLGFTVVGAKKTKNGTGHIATVAPGYDFDKNEGPMMANVGGSDKEGFRRAKDAYRDDNYEKGNVKFYFNFLQLFKKEDD